MNPIVYVLLLMKETKRKRGKVVYSYLVVVWQTIFSDAEFLYVHRSRSMQYLLVTVVVMMICGQALYSPKNNRLSLPPITIVVGIDDGTDDSSWSSHPSTEVSSPALSIKNESFIYHSPDATSSTAKRDDEVNGVETSDMYSKALVVYRKMSHLKHEKEVTQDSMIHPRCCGSSYEKSGIELISIAWEKHEVESRADVFYQSQPFLDTSDTNIKVKDTLAIKDSRSISNTTTKVTKNSLGKDTIFFKTQVDKRVSTPPPISKVSIDALDMVRDRKTPELKSSFSGLLLITLCLLVISICHRISMQQEARLATAKAKVAISIQSLFRGTVARRSLASKAKAAVNIQRLCHGIAGRNRSRSLAAAKIYVAINIQRLVRGRSGRDKARLLTAKIKVAVNMQRLFWGRAIRMEPPGITWSSLEQRQQGLTTARAEGMGDDSTISTHFTWNTLSYQSSEHTGALSRDSNNTRKYAGEEDIEVREERSILNDMMKEGIDVLYFHLLESIRDTKSELISGQKNIMKMIKRGDMDVGSKVSGVGQDTKMDKEDIEKEEEVKEVECEERIDKVQLKKGSELKMGMACSHRWGGRSS